LVSVACAEPVYIPVAAQLQAAMVHPIGQSFPPADLATAWLIGPGLAAFDLAPTLRAFAVNLWQQCPQPVVADASALDWLSESSEPSAALRVITPHPGEAARLLRITTAAVQADRVRALRQLSERYGRAWVVLKGHQTLIGRAEGPIFVNCSGNPGLAQGGSGDILAGYLTGLLAQPALQADPSTTLRFGVWQHGAAADDLADRTPAWIIEELVESLGSVPAT